MLQYSTVEPHTLELLRELMSREYLKNFVLVGGTALALQIGHRKSVDLDLFTLSDFTSEKLLENLKTDYQVLIRAQSSQSLIVEINRIKVDFIRFKYPFIRPILRIDDLRMLGTEDIAPMKLDAITGRGSKKDFFDLYFLLQKYSLKELLDLYAQKYDHQTIFHVIRSLSYFLDAESDPEPMVFDKKVTWAKVKKLIGKQVQTL